MVLEKRRTHSQCYKVHDFLRTGEVGLPSEQHYARSHKEHARVKFSATRRSVNQLQQINVDEGWLKGRLPNGTIYEVRVRRVSQAPTVLCEFTP